MLKQQIWIAECDVCGKIEKARSVSGKYNETDYYLPMGWKQGKNPNFCLCPDCFQALKEHNMLKE